MQPVPENPEQDSPAEQSQKPAVAIRRVALKWSLIGVAVLLLAAVVASTVAYYRLSKRVDRQLAAGTLGNSLTFFTAPETLWLGLSMSASDLAAAWKRCGYAVTAKGSALVAQAPAPVEIHVDRGQISAIIDVATGRHVTQYELPPQLITNMPDKGRAKRIVVHIRTCLRC